MFSVNAQDMGFEALNELIRKTEKGIIIKDCSGQRFLGSGAKGKRIEIYGTPGNALGAYLDGGEIIVHGNVQDAVGDTMNDGKIVVEGGAGDAVGYAMRGGEIYIKENAGYRVGIHMKAYADKLPVMVIGGTAGSFLGEYQAGGVIVVLNKNNEKKAVGALCGTGMHGGKIFIRCDELNAEFPPQVHVAECNEEDMKEILPYLREYRRLFGTEVVGGKYFVLTPNSSNPYRQLYVEN
ncbi:MAG: glutamate synthase [Christensenellales bacterium]